MKIYRFVSFYDAFDILVRRKLRFSKLSTFEDKNEGIGNILMAQESVLSRYRNIHSEGMINTYKSSQNNTYLSCWTLEPDMIAMWSIYSRDNCSIRIETTLDKLEGIVNQFSTNMYWEKHNFQDSDFKSAHVSWSHKIKKVNYVKFTEIRDKIRNKYQKFYVCINNAAKANPNYFNSDDGFSKDYNDLHLSPIIGDDGIFLKDISYKHEEEIRAVINSGIVDNTSLEEWRNAPLSNPIAAMDPIREALPDEIPNYIYADIPIDFVDSICFDPRMPSYKRKVYEEIFKDKITTITNSTAFGFLFRS